MDLLPDTNEAQLRQLSDDLFTSREVILKRWQSSLDKALRPFTRRSHEAFTDLFLLLLDELIGRIRGSSQTNDLVGQVGQHQFHRWRGGLTLAELTLEVDHFYNVLAEQIQQFVELYPQT